MFPHWPTGFTLQRSLMKPSGNCQNGSSTYRGAGGISEHLILWPGWHFARAHGGTGGPPDDGFIIVLFPSLLSLKIKDLYPLCFLLRNSESFSRFEHVVFCILIHLSMYYFTCTLGILGTLGSLGSLGALVFFLVGILLGVFFQEILGRVF